MRNDEAARLAEEAGLKVVMNRCPKIEYGRLRRDRRAGATVGRFPQEARDAGQGDQQLPSGKGQTLTPALCAAPERTLSTMRMLARGWAKAHVPGLAMSGRYLLARDRDVSSSLFQSIYASLPPLAMSWPMPAFTVKIVGRQSLTPRAGI